MDHTSPQTVVSSLVGSFSHRRSIISKTRIVKRHRNNRQRSCTWRSIASLLAILLVASSFDQEERFSILFPGSLAFSPATNHKRLSRKGGIIPLIATTTATSLSQPHFFNHYRPKVSISTVMLRGGSAADSAAAVLSSSSTTTAVTDAESDSKNDPSPPSHQNDPTATTTTTTATAKRAIFRGYCIC
mmetsp:Transcript_7623/g.15650  ORF Transcript_7623/g.15650 Transcript_7623/m.15650 type:complete len:187 (+) Transcript_7623:252-812(+)